MEQADCIVIGAGVIGLAVARSLALAGREVLILEAGDAIGAGTSSRNSEVIHAGIYYPGGSLKARFCVTGREALYDYCTERGVAHKRIGKLIVATSEDQIPTLHALDAQARANGVDNLRWLDARAARRLEPEVHAVAALLSPATGIVDSHALMLAYLGEAEDHGATLALHAPVTGGRSSSEGLVLHVGGAAPMALCCRIAVNCAGLAAQTVARSIDGVAPASVPRAYFAKGCYYALNGPTPFSRLIYPVPEPGGLGVHLTLDLGGQARFGPDVEWVESLDYTVPADRADRFHAAIRSYYPGLKDGALRPDYAGIRPKVNGPGETAGDFLIHDSRTHGATGLINLYGIESPGLTASMAIAAEVLDRLHI